MCNSNCINWGKDNLSPAEICGAKVVDIGSYNVNGSLREEIEKYKPYAYIGIDIRKGPGVDLICPAEELSKYFPPGSFDIVISTCTLEHIEDWRAAIHSMKALCRLEGWILIIVPFLWPEHDYPKDYWRFSQRDIINIFSDCELSSVERDYTEKALVYAKIRKPTCFVEKDLSGYNLMAVKNERKRS